MKAIRMACALAVAASLAPSAARADDIVAMISQYRREHGLPAVKIDPRFTAVAERQARAMAASGIMDHDVAGSFSSRIAGVQTDSAGENIAEGTKTWADTLRLWQNSPGHNANLLLRDADVIGIAFARNDATRYKTYWAMVIGHKKSADGGGKPIEASSAPQRREASKASAAGASAASGAASAVGAAAAFVTNALSTGRKWLLGE